MSSMTFTLTITVGGQSSLFWSYWIVLNSIWAEPSRALGCIFGSAALTWYTPVYRYVSQSMSPGIWVMAGARLKVDLAKVF